MSETAASAPRAASVRFLLPALHALLSAVVAWPVLAASQLPFVDFPQHVSQVALWAAHGHDADVARHYDVHLDSPYVGLYVIWRAFTLLGLSVPAAGHVVVALLVVTTPLSVAWLLRARNRPPEWAFLAYPAVYHHSLTFGFLPFCLTLPLFFASLALFSRWSQRGGVGRAVLVTLSGLLILWSHALTAGLWGLACGLLALLDRGSWRQRLVRLAPLVPVGLLLGRWALANGGGGSISLGGGLLDRLQQTRTFMMGGLTEELGAAGRWLKVLAAAAVAFGVASALRRERSGPPLRRLVTAFDLPLVAVAACAFTLFLILPFEGFGTFWIYGRFLPFAFLLAVASLAPVRWPAARGLLVAGAVALSVSVAVRLHHACDVFDRALGDADALFAALPPKASVLSPGNHGGGLAPFVYPVLDHVATLAQSWTLGGASTFAGNAHMLMQHAPASPPPAIDAVLEREPHWHVHARNGALPTALVFHTEAPPPATITADDGGAPYRLLRRTGGLNAFVR